ncbi:unnamed protein product, partial [Rotaria sp. Silwood2]
MIASFCSEANLTIVNAIQQFRSTAFISAQVLPPKPFQVLINNAIQQFQALTSAGFVGILEPIRVVGQGNALITVMGTNWSPRVTSFDDDVPFLFVPVEYN